MHTAPRTSEVPCEFCHGDGGRRQRMQCVACGGMGIVAGDEPVAISRLRTLADAAEEALDHDTYEQKRSHDFDPPDDAELTIRAGTVRKIEALIAALYGVIGDTAEQFPTRAAP
jgi:RecJ-like exonuclease